MPDILKDAILGLVQGLTEFLPVSSSGHLVVVPELFGWEQPSIAFDLLLHVATLGAVLVYFRRDLIDLARGLLGAGDNPQGERRLALLLVAGTIPAAIIGLALNDPVESLFDKPLWVCAFWVVTAGILVGSERLLPRVTPRGLDLRGAVLIGTAQAAALLPGISRSGTTIAVGLLIGLSRTDAARFSFLLAIPAIAGGGLTLIPDVASGSFEITSSVLVGMAVAAVSGYAAVAGMLRFVRSRALTPFALYLVVAAPAAALAL